MEEDATAWIQVLYCLYFTDEEPTAQCGSRTFLREAELSVSPGSLPGEFTSLGNISIGSHM